MASSKQRAVGPVRRKRLQCGAAAVEALPVLDGRSEEEGTTLYRDEGGERFFLENGEGVSELTPSDALSWAAEQCFRGWHLGKFIKNACAGTIWTEQQGKSAGLSRQLGQALARNLRDEAARHNRTPYEHMRNLLVHGLAGGQSKRRNARWAERHAVGENRATQLELATTLVEVVRKLEIAPSEGMLANAKLAASELNRSLSQEAPLMAANG